jgi:cytochrome c oxidase subunit 2
VQLSTKDVIHSFNLPHMRVKQDALPGKTIPVWFKPTDYNVEPSGKDGKPSWIYRGGLNADTGRANDSNYVWEIACAELCGWGHYRMIGRAIVHKDEADFERWLEFAAASQNDFGPNAQAK